MSTPKSSNASADALAAALNSKLQWKAVSAVIESVRTATAINDSEKGKLQELLSASDDVVLAIIESSSTPAELISDLTNYVRSSFPEASTATNSASAAATTTNSASAHPPVPQPITLPGGNNNGTPQPSPLLNSPPAKLNITVNSPGGTQSAATTPAASAGAPSTGAAAHSSSFAAAAAASKLPQSSPPLGPGTPDLSSASPMITASSPQMGAKAGVSGLPSLSLSDGKSTSQQIKELETAYENSYKLLSAVAAKDNGKERETVKTGVRSIVKMLENLKKHPTALQYRKLRMDNLVVKKYVAGLDGAQLLMEAVGFRKVEVGVGAKKVLYLSIDESEVKGEVIDRSIDLLTKYSDVLEKPIAATPTAAAASSGKLLPCRGKNCNFYGDASRDGYCSQCFKGNNAKSDSGSAAAAAAASGGGAGAKPAVSGAAAATDKPGKVTGLCTKNCGFFGNETWKGMCSSCYTANKANVKKTWRKHIHIAMIKLRAMRQFTVLTKKPIQKQKNRCWKCARKIGITGIECRCGYLFCAAHRYANEHDCDFDHKEMQRQKLAKENKEVKGKKLQKIGEPENES